MAIKLYVFYNSSANYFEKHFIKKTEFINEPHTIKFSFCATESLNPPPKKKEINFVGWSHSSVPQDLHQSLF